MSEPSVTDTPPLDPVARAEQIYRATLQESAVPPHLHDGIVQYLIGHKPPGNLLRAVLENDLIGAAGRADRVSGPELMSLVSWLMTYAPVAAWTSPEAVQAWIERPAPGAGRSVWEER